MLKVCFGTESHKLKIVMNDISHGEKKTNKKKTKIDAFSKVYRLPTACSRCGKLKKSRRKTEDKRPQQT